MATNDTPLLSSSTAVATSTALERAAHDIAKSPASAPTGYLPNGAGASLADNLNLRDYLQIISKRKWLIASIVIITTTIVALYMYRQPSIYEARTTLQIEPKVKPLLQSKEIVFSTQNDVQYRNTQLKLLENPRLMRQVALALNLSNNNDFFSNRERRNLFATLRGAIGGDDDDNKRQASTGIGIAPVADATTDALNAVGSYDNLTAEQLAALEPYEDALREGLGIEPGDKNNLVDITFKHTKPEIAQAVVTTIARTFIENETIRDTTGSRAQAEKLARQVTELQLEIQQLEQQRLNFVKAENLPQGEIKGQDLTAARLETLSSQSLDAEKERKEAEAAWEAARTARDPNAIPEVQSDTQIGRLRQKLNDLMEKRAGLLVQYTEDYPEVEKVDEQIKQTNEDLSRSANQIINSLRLKYEAAANNEGKLQSSYAQERSTANARSAATITLSDLNQRLETRKELYNTATKRQKELDITSDEKPNNVSITTEARLPRAPVGPPRKRNIMIALLLSLMAGVGLAVMLDSLDDTLKSIEDVDRYLHLPTLALIPAPKPERGGLKGRATSKSTSVAARNAGDAASALTLIKDARSPVAESYRHLRTSLLLSSAGSPPRVVLVTSSQPSEGKTTTAINTAMTLAQTGARVLILDCDLRRPRIHTHFDLPNGRGLTNYLAGEEDINDLLHDYQPMPNLNVLASGPIPPNPAELLGSDDMRRLLQTLRERFQHIIIDSPPTISFTDAAILSTLVDGVMLVVHGGRSSRAIVRRARQQLLDVGANIYGIVLNNVKLESSDYNYYANYYASYYDGAEEEEEAAAEKTNEKTRV